MASQQALEVQLSSRLAPFGPFVYQRPLPEDPDGDRQLGRWAAAPVATAAPSASNPVVKGPTPSPLPRQVGGGVIHQAQSQYGSVRLHASLGAAALRHLRSRQQGRGPDGWETHGSVHGHRDVYGGYDDRNGGDVQGGWDCDRQQTAQRWSNGSHRRPYHYPSASEWPEQVTGARTAEQDPAALVYLGRLQPVEADANVGVSRRYRSKPLYEASHGSKPRWNEPEAAAAGQGHRRLMPGGAAAASVAPAVIAVPAPPPLATQVVMLGGDVRLEGGEGRRRVQSVGALPRPIQLSQLPSQRRQEPLPYDCTMDTADPHQSQPWPRPQPPPTRPSRLESGGAYVLDRSVLANLLVAGAAARRRQGAAAVVVAAADGPTVGNGGGSGALDLPAMSHCEIVAGSGVCQPATSPRDGNGGLGHAAATADVAASGGGSATADAPAAAAAGVAAASAQRHRTVGDPGPSDGAAVIPAVNPRSIDAGRDVALAAVAAAIQPKPIGPQRPLGPGVGGVGVESLSSATRRDVTACGAGGGGSGATPPTRDLAPVGAKAEAGAAAAPVAGEERNGVAERPQRGLACAESLVAAMEAAADAAASVNGEAAEGPAGSERRPGGGGPRQGLAAPRGAAAMVGGGGAEADVLDAAEVLLLLRKKATQLGGRGGGGGGGGGGRRLAKTGARKRVAPGAASAPADRQVQNDTDRNMGHGGGGGGGSAGAKVRRVMRKAAGTGTAAAEAAGQRGGGDGARSSTPETSAGACPCADGAPERARRCHPGLSSSNSSGRRLGAEGTAPEDAVVAFQGPEGAAARSSRAAAAAAGYDVGYGDGKQWRQQQPYLERERQQPSPLLPSTEARQGGHRGVGAHGGVGGDGGDGAMGLQPLANGDGHGAVCDDVDPAARRHREDRLNAAATEEGDLPRADTDCRHHPMRQQQQQQERRAERVQQYEQQQEHDKGQRYEQYYKQQLYKLYYQQQMLEADEQQEQRFDGQQRWRHTMPYDQAPYYHPATPSPPQQQHKQLQQRCPHAAAVLPGHSHSPTPQRRDDPWFSRQQHKQPTTATTTIKTAGPGSSRREPLRAERAAAGSGPSCQLAGARSARRPRNAATPAMAPLPQPAAARPAGGFQPPLHAISCTLPGRDCHPLNSAQKTDALDTSAEPSCLHPSRPRTQSDLYVDQDPALGIPDPGFGEHGGGLQRRSGVVGGATAADYENLRALIEGRPAVSWNVVLNLARQARGELGFFSSGTDGGSILSQQQQQGQQEIDAVTAADPSAADVNGDVLLPAGGGGDRPAARGGRADLKAEQQQQQQRPNRQLPSAMLEQEGSEQQSDASWMAAAAPPRKRIATGAYPGRGERRPEEQVSSGAAAAAPPQPHKQQPHRVVDGANGSWLVPLVASYQSFSVGQAHCKAAAAAAAAEAAERVVHVLDDSSSPTTGESCIDQRAGARVTATAAPSAPFAAVATAALGPGAGTGGTAALAATDAMVMPIAGGLHQPPAAVLGRHPPAGQAGAGAGSGSGGEDGGGRSSSTAAAAVPPPPPPTSGRGGGPVPVDIAIEDLRRTFEMPAPEAARRLGISATNLKRKCRQFGILRWPHRKLDSLHRLRSLVTSDVADTAVRQALLENIAHNVQQIIMDPNTEMAHSLKNLRQMYYKRGFDVRMRRTLGRTADSDESI